MALLWEAADAQVGTAVGYNDAMLRTTDGGATWEPQTREFGRTVSFYDVSYADPKIGFALEGWFAGWILFSTIDGGENRDVEETWDFGAMGSLPRGDAHTIMVLGMFGYAFRTMDGGASWQMGLKPFPESYFLLGAEFTSSTTGTAVGAGGMIARTNDGGDTWSPFTRGAVADLHGVSFSDANHGVAVGMYDTILRTVDGGNSWVSQEITTEPSADGLSDVFATDTDTMTAVGYWGIWRSKDAGATWEN